MLLPYLLKYIILVEQFKTRILKLLNKNHNLLCYFNQQYTMNLKSLWESLRKKRKKQTEPDPPTADEIKEKE